MFDPVSSTQPPSQSGTSRHTALCSSKSPCVSSPVTILVVHATVLCTFHPAHGLPIIFPSTPAKDAGSADFEALYVTPWYVIHTSPTIQQQIHTPYTTNISISSFSSMPIISLIPHCGPHTILLQHTILNSTVNCYIRSYQTPQSYHYPRLTLLFTVLTHSLPLDDSMIGLRPHYISMRIWLNPLVLYCESKLLH